jgi:uncharacterized protein (DUF1800 family)
MPLYGCQPPTGYADTAAAWLNAGALLGRMNFAVALAGGRLPGVVPDVARAPAAQQAMALTLGSPEFQKR